MKTRFVGKEKWKRLSYAFLTYLVGMFILANTWILLTSASQDEVADLSNQKPRGVFYDAIGITPSTSVLAADTKRKLLDAKKRSVEPAYTVQIGTAPSKIEAQRIAGQPELSQKNCFYVAVSDRGSDKEGSKYSIRCGVYTSKKQAARSLRRLSRNVRGSSKIERF